MENRDILFNILARVGNLTLGKFVSSSLWPKIKALLNDNEFWHARTEYLIEQELAIGSGIEWKKVYKTLNLTLARKPMVWSNLDYLPAVHILEGLFGAPYIYDEDIWSEIASVDVLNYMIKKKYVEVSIDNLLTCLQSAAENGRENMIEHLVDLIAKTMDDEEMSSDEVSDTGSLVRSCIKVAAEHGHLKTMLALIHATDYRMAEDENELLIAGMEGGYADVITYLLDRTDESSALELAIDVDSSIALRLLLSRGNLLVDINKLFDNSIDNGAAKCVELMLDLEMISEESLDWNKLLINAIHSGHSSLVEFILRRDEALEISEEMIQAALSNYNTTIAYLLVSDDRIAVEELSSRMINALLRNPTQEVSDSMIGLRIGRGSPSISRDTLISYLIDQVSNQDIYSLLLRVVILKRPTAKRLTDWMISMNNKQLIAAAHSILHNEIVTSYLVPLRAIMLVLLYPTMSFNELIRDLRAEGATQNELRLSGQLVGAYLGSSRMNKQQ